MAARGSATLFVPGRPKRKSWIRAVKGRRMARPRIFISSTFYDLRLGFFVLDRTTRTAPAAREGVSAPVSGTVSDAPAAVGGVAPVLMYPCRKAPGPHAGRTTSRDASAGWFLLTGGGMSSWCGWHWPAVFPVEDPVAVLVHCLTTTRQLARYRQDGKRPPARSPQQGRRPSRPSTVAAAQTGPSTHRPPRPCWGPRALAPPLSPPAGGRCPRPPSRGN